MKTVLNFKNIDFTKQPLFLGEDLNYKDTIGLSIQYFLSYSKNKMKTFGGLMK